MTKLSQVLAVEKSAKGQFHSEITEAYKVFQKPALFDGFSKTYEKKDEDSDDEPAQRKRAEHSVRSILSDIGRRATDLFNIEATKDFANCQAKADVTIDGKTILKDVPPTFLLFLEKQLTDFKTFIGAMPVLDPSEDWNFDENAGVYKTGIVKTTKTKKVQKPIVLYPATPEHPAQTQLITEDVQVGTWNTVKHSGAVPKGQRDRLLERIETLLKAVKCAREEANGSSAAQQEAGKKIFDFIMAD